MTLRRALTAVGAGALTIVAFASAAGTQLDWSTGRTHSLAETTVAFVDEIDQPVTLEIFYATDQPGRADVIELARRFAGRNPLIDVTVEDPDSSRAVQLRVASGAVAATASTGRPAAIRNPDETDLAAIIATATGQPDPAIEPHRQPSQPLFPTSFGRTLLWLVPTTALPATLALGGLTIIWHRRRRSR